MPHHVIDDPKSAVLFRDGVRELILVQSKFNPAFIVMNSLATIVACYGLLMNNPATVIGAMVIATFLNAISGVALALVDGNRPLLTQSLKTAMLGIFIVLSISILIGLIHRRVPVTSEMTARTHPYITDLFVAVAGGAAGAYAMVSPRVSAGLVGVAIATALVPPLATCGLILAKGEFALALGAFELFAANFVAIQLSTSAVLWIRGFRGIGAGNASFWVMVSRHTMSISILTLLAVALGFNFLRGFSTEVFESNVRDQLRTFSTTKQAVLLDVQFRHATSRKETRVIATYATPVPFADSDERRLESELAANQTESIELELRYIIVGGIGGSDAPPAEVPQGRFPKLHNE